VKKGDELELKLESFAFEGKAVARVDGLVVFVEGGVAGDEVRARLTKIKKQFAEARVIETLRNSPLRTQPRCVHFGTCGGCKWQHVDYQAQLQFKRQHVVDALERIGGFDGVKVNPTLGSDDIYYYRNKMEFSFGQRWLTQEEMEDRRQAEGDGRQEEGDRKQEIGERAPEAGRFALGLHIPQRFDRVLDVQECWLQSETSNRILNTVKKFSLESGLDYYSTFTHTGYLRNLVIREGKNTGEVMVNLVTSEDRPETMLALNDVLLQEVPSITTVINNITTRKSQVAIGEIEKVYYGPGYITERLGKRTYRISANSFFQTNTKQAERLYDITRRMADLKSSDVVFDLYSGTGTIAFHIADDVAEVVCIESVEAAVEDAKRNAEFNGVRNCTFVLGDLKDRLTRDSAWLENHPEPSVMIIDPPRSGMHEKVVGQVLQLRPERIVYVSCNPATQARDLKLMCEGGRYEIVEVQPVDMFPHTYHIENVVGLRVAPTHT